MGYPTDSSRSPLAARALGPDGKDAAVAGADGIMNKKTIGSLIFAVLSALLWGLTIYLLGRSGESRTLHTFGLAAGFTASILTLHTILYAVFANRKTLEGDWFRRHGKPMEAEIIKISRYGYHMAWRVKARHLDRKGGRETIFKSDILRSNPNAKFSIGDTIRVYRHPTDSRRYWMDVGLPSKYL